MRTEDVLKEEGLLEEDKAVEHFDGDGWDLYIANVLLMAMYR